MAFAQIDDYFIERLHLLTRNEIVVYTYLVKSRNRKSKKCNPKQSKIAADTHLQTSRVSEAVKGLEAKGWAVMDESGDYFLPEKVTESVTTQLTNSVRKSYGKRNKKLRNAEDEVTHCVTEIKGIENTSEHTKEKTIEKREDAGEPARTPAPEQFQTSIRNIEILESERHAETRSDDLADCLAISVFESTFKITVGISTATEIQSRIKNLAVWENLIRDKIAFADKPLSQRKAIANWIFTAYDERIQKLNGVKTNEQFKSSLEKRSDAAISDYQFAEQIRQRNADRRQNGL